jgi:1,2-diacylglycerol 3-beta-glucosyltransferase
VTPHAGTLFNATMAVALLLLAWGFAQFVLWYRWGTAELRTARADQGNTPDRSYRVVFLIPCLDEEKVIGATVAALRRLDPLAGIVVIDDASDDRTGDVAVTAGAMVTRRGLPFARRGKGPALNHGFRHLLTVARARNFDLARTIVCVLDADGRLSDNAVDEVLKRFDDPTVGGVQLPVRIRNKRKFLARMQDFEFWGMSAIAQMARGRTRSVSLGGNGQFTRLSALAALGDEPWSDALTEDLDLGLELTLHGWALECAPAAWVSQQGVETLRALLRQRTRWYQGHMLCARKARSLWESELVPRSTALETTVYLLSPTFVMLPWSIAFTLGLGYFGVNLAEHRAIPLDGTHVHVALYAAFWYLLTFLPPMLMGVLYARRSEDESVLGGILKGHLQVFYAYVNMAAGWRALIRISLGRHTWIKTARVAEAGIPVQRAA